jgi:hypothetical protein
MKYLKRFNEELKPETYRNAAKLLDTWGHKGRAYKLKDWSDQVELRNELEKHRQNINSLYKHEPFEIEIYRSTWDSAKKASYFRDEVVYVGNFYMAFTLSDWWSQDMIRDWIYDGKKYNFNIPIEVILFPVEEELKKFNDSAELFTTDIYDNSILTSRIWVTIVKPGESSITDDGGCYIEACENDNIFFKNRSEATRFKNMFISGLMGQNNLGKSKWNSKNLNEQLKKLISEFKEDEISKSDDDIDKIVKNAKRLSVNRLYRN